MFLCRCRRSKVGGMGFLELISQAFPRPLPQSPLVFSRSFARYIFRSLYFSLALYYLNAWNRLAKGAFYKLLRAGVSFFCLSSPPPPCSRFLFFALALIWRGQNAKFLKKAEKSTEVLATQAIGTHELRHMNGCHDLQMACNCHWQLPQVNSTV